jgi:hypothetical protein
MSVHSAVWVDNLFIANHTDPQTVTLNAHVTSHGKAFRGDLELSILHDGQQVWCGSVPVSVRASGDTVVSKPKLYERQWLGQPGKVGRFVGFAGGTLSVDLLFADASSTRTGERVFDIALNGRVVAKDFDIFAEAGGRESALVKTFTVAAPDGNLLLSVPTSAKGRPMVAAIRVTDARGTVERFVFRRDAVKDANGQLWRSMMDGSLIGFDWASVRPQALDRARKGARLIVVGADAVELSEPMNFLAHNDVLSFKGTAGADNTAWIWHWYFGKKHWLLDGLPSDCVFDWQYQAGAGGDGLIVDAPGIEAVIGYGKNPGPNLGLGAAVIPYGQGEIRSSWC